MNRNLSPQSEPWGREVDRRLTVLENSVFTLEQETTAAFQGLNATLQKLSEQVTSLGSAVSALQANRVYQSTDTTSPSFDIPAGTVNTWVYASTGSVVFDLPPNAAAYIYFGAGEVSATPLTATDNTCESAMDLWDNRSNSSLGYVRHTNAISGGVGAFITPANTTSLMGQRIIEGASSTQTLDLSLRCGGRHWQNTSASRHLFANPFILVQVIGKI